MNKYYYKHLSNWERRKIESLIGNKPILKPISGQTDHGWDVVDWKWLIDINSLASQLKRNRKTIKRELLNGRYETLTNSISKIALLSHIQLIFLDLTESKNTNLKISKKRRF